MTTRSSALGPRRRFVVGLVAGLAVVALVGCGGDGTTGAARRTTASTTSPPPTTTVTATTVAPTTTIPPATTTTVPPPPGVPAGNPWPVVGSYPAGHHAVLVFGDSLAGQMYWSLPWAVGVQGLDVVAYDATMPTAGLLDPMYGLAPPDFLAAQLDAHPDVDTAVFEFAGACRTACDPGGVEYGSPEFYDRWNAVAVELMDQARGRGLDVVWAISPPPPLPSDPTNARLVRAIEVSAALVELDRRYPATQGVVAADWYTALADTAGNWQPALWYDGALHDVRVDDRVHFTPDGSLRATSWTIAALAVSWAR